VKFCPFFKFFLVWRKLPFFGQSCSLSFSLRSLDIPAILKSWLKHYLGIQNRIANDTSTLDVIIGYLGGKMLTNQHSNLNISKYDQYWFLFIRPRRYFLVVTISMLELDQWHLPWSFDRVNYNLTKLFNCLVEVRVPLVQPWHVNRHQSESMTKYIRMLGECGDLE
jgi:hypothetical protein